MFYRLPPIDRLRTKTPESYEAEVLSQAFRHKTHLPVYTNLNIIARKKIPVYQFISLTSTINAAFFLAFVFEDAVPQPSTPEQVHLQYHSSPLIVRSSN